MNDVIIPNHPPAFWQPALPLNSAIAKSKKVIDRQKKTPIKPSDDLRDL